jgi:hypothetical protein
MRLLISTSLLLALFTGCQLAQPLPPTPPAVSPQPALPYCGDGTCDSPFETPISCPEDCPAPAPSPPSPPSPPRCPDSIDLGSALPLDRMDTTTGAPAATDRASCGDGTSAPAIVYEWTAAENGVYRFSVTASFAAVLQLRRSDCLGGEQACTASQTDVQLTAGEPIGIAVTGDAGASGDFELAITRLPAVCGNGICEANEQCDECTADCGACPYCGDGTCDAGESCDSCSSDCGAC